MATKLVWTPKARADLRKIYADIARQQPAAADR
jgi:toxin ParE1/3/4